MKDTKRIVLLALAVAALMGCSKETQAPAVKMQDITLGLGNIQTGDLSTKGIPALISASVPSGDITIKLVSTTNANRTYSIKAGQAASVAIDTYTATATYRPTAIYDCWKGYFYAEPCLSVNTSLTIEEGKETYTLPASYDCFALVWDKAMTASYSVWSASGAPEVPSINWVEEEGLALVYVRCKSAWTASSGLIIYANPADDVNYEMTTYNLVTTSAADCVLVENGKWYTFNPGAVATSSGSLSLTFPEWTAGN